MPILLAQLEIASPGRLLVLVLLPALVYLALRGRRDLSAGRKITATSLRCLVFALVCLAWAAPSCRRESSQKFVVVAIDGSASSSSDAAEQSRALLSQLNQIKPHGDQLQVLTFAGAPTQLTSVHAADWTEALQYPGATNISTALSLSQAICPPDHVPHIVLLSDGLETRGDALQAAMGTDIPISVIPLKPFPADYKEVAIDEIVAPHFAFVDEPFEVGVKILANKAGKVRLQLRGDGETIAETELDIAAGETWWSVNTVFNDLDDWMTIEAIVSGPGDTHEENNRLAAIVARRPTRSVLIVGNSDTDSPLSLRDTRLAGSIAQMRTPDELPESAADLERFDLVVLVDTSAAEFRPRQLAALDGYVRAGGGLIATGGEATFGAAAYELTTLEKMLPVVATEQPLQQQKSLALVLVVDKSKSMEQENRLGLAKEAAKKVAEVLQERDQVGVLAFGDESQWISRLAPLNNKQEVLARIDKLSAEGLTNMYPAIQRAYLSLSQADADSRHVILLTDGVPTPGDFEDVARRMAEAGITVSTVSLGSGADQTILKDLSRIAGGNHHHVDNPDDLPHILERETRTAAAKVTDNEFTAATFRQLPGLNLRGAPPLSGYVATNYKPGAQLLLTAGEGDPLLAWWRHGRGKAMVLTTDLAKSAAAWNSWEGKDAFWRRLVRFMARDPSSGDSQLAVQQQDGKVIATLDVVQPSEAGVAYSTDVIASLKSWHHDASGKVHPQSFPMQQVAPGRYQVVIPAAAEGHYMLEAAVISGDEVIAIVPRGIAIDYPEEFRLRPIDEVKLKSIARVTGGKYHPQPEEIFAPDGRTVDIVYPLWPYVLMAALLLYLVETAVRRFPSRQPAATQVVNRKAA